MEENSDFSFDFDQPRAGEKAADHHAPVSDTREATGRASCSCPKCSAQIDGEASEIDQKHATTCMSCKSGVIIIRETSANRARRRSQKISCAICGNILDHHLHCTSCGTLFPDHYVAVLPEEIRRKAKEKQAADFRHSLSRFTPSLYFDFLRRPTESVPHSRPTAASASTRSLVTPRLVRLALFILIFFVLAGGGSYAYHSQQRQQQFIKSYVKAIYGLKTGTDFNLNFCGRMATKWKSATESGLRFTPGFNEKELTKSTKIRNNIDNAMQQTSDPPKKFIQAQQKLVQLRAVYQKSHDLASSPPESLQAFSTSIDRVRAEFTAAAKELKGSMPEDFNTELERTKQMYRGMRDF